MLARVMIINIIMLDSVAVVIATVEIVIPWYVNSK